MEIIICSAIWYPTIETKKQVDESLRLPINCDKGLVFCGFRHVHCMYTMIAITGLRSVPSEVGEEIQGFLTNKNRFVSRTEAAEIAYICGQIEKRKYVLFSEDLY